MKRLLGGLILSVAMLATSISFAAEQSTGVSDSSTEQKSKPVGTADGSIKQKPKSAAAATAPKKQRKTYGSNRSYGTSKKSSTKTTNPGTTTK